MKPTTHVPYTLHKTMLPKTCRASVPRIAHQEHPTPCAMQPWGAFQCTNEPLKATNKQCKT